MQNYDFNIQVFLQIKQMRCNMNLCELYRCWYAHFDTLEQMFTLVSGLYAKLSQPPAGERNDFFIFWVSTAIVDPELKGPLYKRADFVPFLFQHDDVHEAAL